MYNAVQTWVALTKYPQETVKILQTDIFGFFLRDEEFVSKTINDSNIDLNKIPASKVCQLAKKMESSKATAKHIKQVASDPQPQHTFDEMPVHRITPRKFQRKEKHFTPWQDTNKQYFHEDNHKQYYKEDKERRYNSHQAHTNQERCKKCGDSKHIEGFRCPVRNTNVRIAINLVISVAYAKRRLDMKTKGPWSQDHPRHIN